MVQIGVSNSEHISRYV